MDCAARVTSKSWTVEETWPLPEMLPKAEREREKYSAFSFLLPSSLLSVPLLAISNQKPVGKVA